VPRSDGSETSSKSGRLAPLPPRRDDGASSSRSGRFAALPTRTDVREQAAPYASWADDTAEETKVQAPATLPRRQDDVVTAPEGHRGILNAPTAMQPAIVETAETRIGLDVVPRAPAPARPKTLAEELRSAATPFLVATALLAVGLLVNWANTTRTEKRMRESWQLTSVIVAAEEMSAGTVITPDNVAQRAVPTASVGERSDVVRADSLPYILEQRLAVDVQMGDPLFYSQFIANRGNQRLSQRIMKQMRGYTIPASALRAVGHHVKPGDVVDLVATFQMQGRNVQQNRGQHRAVTVLQAVTVLATGKIADFTPGAAIDEHEKPYDHVTLLLTAEEAEFVTLARTVGPLTMTLRHEDDREQFAQREYTDINTLLDGKRINAANRRQRQLVDIVKSIRSAPEPK
jgi:Flp pilus assembly protein CpaB